MPEPVVPLDPLDLAVAEGSARRQHRGRFPVHAVGARVRVRRGKWCAPAREPRAARPVLCPATPSARQEVSP